MLILVYAVLRLLGYSAEPGQCKANTVLLNSPRSCSVIERERDHRLAYHETRQFFKVTQAGSEDRPTAWALHSAEDPAFGRQLEPEASTTGGASSGSTLQQAFCKTTRNWNDGVTAHSACLALAA